MKKSILLLCGGLCLLAFLSINTSIRHTQEGIDTKLIYLNQKALADGESSNNRGPMCYDEDWKAGCKFEEGFCSTAAVADC
ncbi:MAG: hypothetical protein ACOCWG_01930 [bacterium]